MENISDIIFITIYNIITSCYSFRVSSANINFNDIILELDEIVNKYNLENIQLVENLLYSILDNIKSYEYNEFNREIEMWKPILKTWKTDNLELYARLVRWDSNTLLMFTLPWSDIIDILKKHELIL